MALGLRQFTERAGDGGAGQPPVLDSHNGEELMHVQPNVAVVIGNRAPEAPGTLYITSRQVVWLSDLDRSKGYAADFLSISLHAVSRDAQAYPSPCIYTQIETEADEEETDDSDSEHNEVSDLSKIKEMRLVPSDASQLDTLFEVFCQCAELNPEPIEEDEEGNNWIFSADQMQEDGSGGEDIIEWNNFMSQNPTNPIGHANGDHELAHSVLELRIDDQRFDDAEETESKHEDSRH